MRTPAIAIVVLATVLVASGCAGSGTAKPATSVVWPAAVDPAGSTSVARPVVLPISPKGMRGLDPPRAARFLSSTRLAIAGVAGSSNCPSVPDKLVVRSPHAIRLDLVIGSWSKTASGLRVRVPHSPGICLDDLVPTPVVIAIDPQQIDVHHRLKVSLYYPKTVIRRYKRPVVFTVPPLPTAQVREEVRVARASDLRLFSIFPTVARQGALRHPPRQAAAAGLPRDLPDAHPRAPNDGALVEHHVHRELGAELPARGRLSRLSTHASSHMAGRRRRDDREAGHETSGLCDPLARCDRAPGLPVALVAQSWMRASSSTRRITFCAVPPSRIS